MIIYSHLLNLKRIIVLRVTQKKKENLKIMKMIVLLNLLKMMSIYLINKNKEVRIEREVIEY
jgi:hypothetical protein